MVIDSSALLAILQNEPERRTFNEAIEAAESRVMSAATFVDVSIVIESRFGAEGAVPAMIPGSLAMHGELPYSRQEGGHHGNVHTSSKDR
ncbi:MAG TPA: type II toxin-antitoxin system VapC family toxin [Thermoanaerobaculia bacterium]|nr:type II toxin-antitoxin system VapC family toxin [Thermoanaerobaculia bacterium]